MLNKKQTEKLDNVIRGLKSGNASLKLIRSLSRTLEIPVRDVEWRLLGRKIIPDRYQRNIGSLGIAGQRRLLKSAIMVVGLGGLGGHIVEEMARLGIGRILGVDIDVFDESNLNRQTLSKQTLIGTKKTSAACKRVREINSATEFIPFFSRFENLPAWSWKEADLVFDCLDTIETRLSLSAKCLAARKILIHGAIAGWCGEVSVVWPGQKTLEKVYGCQKQGIEKTLGTPAFTPAVTAGIMTAFGAAVLTGRKFRTSPAIHHFDLLQGQWHTLVMSE